MRFSCFCIIGLVSASTACSSGRGGTNTPDAGHASKTADQLYPVDPNTGLRFEILGPLPPLPEWPDNPPNDAKRDLGQALFADARLSSSGTVTCGTCHSPLADFQSNTPLDLPARSLPDIEPHLPRHTPSLLNIVYAKVLHWDGVESDLYGSMVRPYAEANMNLTDVPKGDVWTVDVPAAKKKLRAKLVEEIPGYVPMFQAAFGTDISQASEDDVWLMAGKALATYIRIAVARDSAFDAWNAGDDSAMSDSAKRGFLLFVGDGHCVSCHNGPMFSDYQFHNLSLLAQNDAGYPVDEGRARVTNDPKDVGAFLTPSLRRVNKTSPYLHDGREAILGRVIQWIASENSRKDPNHDPVLDLIPEFDRDQISDLIQFLKALAGTPVPEDVLKAPPKLP
jgi:cytochrome c peroxidase